MIKKTIAEFSDMPVLIPNLFKSEIFLAGVGEELQKRIGEDLAIRIVTLAVK